MTEHYGADPAAGCGAALVLVALAIALAIVLLAGHVLGVW